MIEKLVSLNELLREQLLSSHTVAVKGPSHSIIDEQPTLKEAITKILSGQTTGDLQTFCTALSGAINRICTDLHALYLSAALSKDYSVKKNQLKFYRNLSNQMEELIWLVNVLSPGNLSDENAVPIATYLPVRTSLKKKTRALSHLVPKLDDHCKPIIGIIQSAISHILRPGVPVSYRLLGYLEEIINVIEGAVADTPGTTINYRLHIKLIAYNFNHPQYIAYCNGKLEEKFGGKPAEEKIVDLGWYEMELRRIIPVPGKALYPQLPDAQNALRVYVTEEIKYLRSLHPDLKEVQKEKLRFKMSVAESSLLFHGMSAPEVEILDESNFHALARFAEKHISTVGAEHISWASFRSNAYRDKPETVVALINKLIRLINWLRAR